MLEVTAGILIIKNCLFSITNNKLTVVFYKRGDTEFYFNEKLSDELLDLLNKKYPMPEITADEAIQEALDCLQG